MPCQFHLLTSHKQGSEGKLILALPFHLVCMKYHFLSVKSLAYKLTRYGSHDIIEVRFQFLMVMCMEMASSGMLHCVLW
jgi:hypothetical protein